MQPSFSDNALTVLRKRYLQPGETPTRMLERVAGGNQEFYDIMARLDLLPNSPALFNLGTGQGTSSACVPTDEIVLCGGTPASVQSVGTHRSHRARNQRLLTHRGLDQKIIGRFKRDYKGDLVNLRPYFLPPLRVTLEHPVLTKDGWKPAHTLRVRDMVFMPTPKFDDALSLDESVAWAIGLYAADGAPYLAGIQFFLNALKDEPIADRLEAVLWEMGALRVKRVYRKNRLDIRASGQHLKTFFTSLVTGTVYDKAFTHRVVESSPRTAAAIIKGWQDGDGCQRQNINYSATVSKELAWQLRSLSLVAEHPMSLIPRQARGHSKACYVLVQSPPKNIQVGEGGYWVPIRSIKHEFYEGPVYNFEVENDHSFTVGGIAVHNCFKFDVHDSMDSILQTAYDAGMVLKYGGGVGYVLSEVRAKGLPVASTHGKACGPVAVIKHYHSLAQMITQGGKREAAQMAVLHVDHPDIREFIHAKDKDPQALSTFNISVACTDDFMEKATDPSHYSSEEAKLLREITASAWRTGDPGCYFIDEAERHNPTPWLGELTGVNPCGEVPLLDAEPCNLGSINLANFVLPSRDGWDWDRLQACVSTSIRFLDDILDRNQFPVSRITKAAAATRKLGLGVMGWADALALLGVPYDSDKAIVSAEEIMNFINRHAKAASRSLGYYAGYYPAGDNESGADKLRNATRTCIAPTGTISILANCSSGIEPHYALENQRTMGDGTVLNARIPVWDRLNGFVPKTALEIPWQWHLQHQAAFQKYTDLAVSKTINMPFEATVRDVRNAYAWAWENNCKGVTVFRNGCREGGEQVLKITEEKRNFIGYAVPRNVTINVAELAINAAVDANATAEIAAANAAARAAKDAEAAIPAIVEEIKKDLVPASARAANGRRRLSEERSAITRKFVVGEQEGYFTVGLYEDGQPGELFLRLSKEGSTIGGLGDNFAISVSLNLQYGVPLDSLCDKFIGTRFEPAGRTNDPNIPFASSIIDYIFRWLKARFLDTPDVKPKAIWDTGLFCPDCGAPTVYQEGCENCTAGCGWSRCG